MDPAADLYPPLGPRVAGVVLVAMAIFSAIGEHLLRQRGLLPSTLLARSTMALTAVELLVGVMLIARVKGAVTWAKLRIVLGGILFVPLLHYTQGWPSALAQAVYCIGVALLLFGRAGATRVVAGLSLCVALLAFGVVAVKARLAGREIPGSRQMLTLLGEVGDHPATDVVGKNLSYRIVVPNGPWLVRLKPSSKEAENVDRELVRLEYGAEVAIVGIVPARGMGVDIDKAAAGWIGETRKGLEDFQLLEESTPRTGKTDARLFHFSGSAKGLLIEAYCGIFVQADHVFAVFAGAPKFFFPTLDSELRAIVLSFEPEVPPIRLPPGAIPRPPEPVPTPAFDPPGNNQRFRDRLRDKQ